MKNQKIFVGLFLVSILSLPLMCSAAIDGKITATLNNIVTDAGLLLAIICTLMIIYAAVLMLTAAGAADKVSTARTIILYAAIGLVIGLLAGPIVKTISSWVS